MATMSLWHWQNEIREGMRRRNDPSPVLRSRNRARVRYAVSQLRAGRYYDPRRWW